MSNLTVNGANLDTLFDPLSSLTKRADVNIRSSGSDISNRFAAASDGTAYSGTTNFRSGGSDIGTLFAGINTVEFYPGNLWPWGHNSTGQLGDNTTIQRNSPVQTVAGGTNWKQFGGGYHSAATKTDGTLWTWGTNTSGQLGDNTATNRSSPIQTVSGGTNWRQVGGLGLQHTMCTKTDGTLWGFGRQDEGRLGDNTTIRRSSPVQTVSGGTNWSRAASAIFHSIAIKTNGTLWAWGHGSNGQLGDNALSARTSPVQTVSGGTNWRLVANSGYHSAAIKTDGTLWTWGNNGFGSLGDNTTIRRSSPVQTVSGGTNWRQVAAGIYHVAAIKTDGTLWTFGRQTNYVPNALGQLGDNTTINRSSPVQTVSGGTNWKMVYGGYYFTTAIKTNGTLWTWGHNGNGGLGDNSTTPKSSPVQTVASGTSWKFVAGCAYHSGGIR